MSFLDFDLGKGKRKRPRATRKQHISPGLNNRNEAKDKSVDKAARRLQELAEKKRLFEEAEKLRKEREERIAAVKLMKESNGIKAEMELKPYPIVKGNTNKITLPPSFLENLMQQSSVEEITPICVELTIQSSGRSESSTYAGIAEFSAPEGSVGIPMKTALSLVKDAGLGILEDCSIAVRYVRLPNYGSLTIKVRPKGKGFFTADEEVVDIDIKTVLEKTLNEHIAIGLNDLIPIFADGKYFILLVEDIRPTDSSIELKEVIEFEDLSNSVDLDEVDKQDILFEITQTGFVILNNDIQIDILPSEADQKRLDERKTFEDLVSKVKFRLNTLRNNQVEVNGSAKDALSFKFNLPNGRKVVLTIDRTEKLEVVFDWILFQISQLEIDFEKVDLEKLLLDKYPFNLDFPKGVKPHLALDDPANLSRTLAELKFNKRTLLFVSWPLVRLIDKGTSEELSDLLLNRPEEASVWQTAFSNVETSDVQLRENVLELPETVTDVGDTTVQEVYDELRNVFGVPKDTAWTVSSKYANSIVQLKEMGFGSRLDEAVPLLIKYGGRVVRVSNALVGNT